MHIAIVPGTNRAGAVSRTLASLIAADYSALGCSVDELALELGPEFLAPTAYKQPTPGITALVGRFLAADGVVFVIPEYNGSFPGVLKLFTDMLPYPQGFDRRPCAFVGIGAGQFQALRAVEHFQGVAGYRNAHIYPNRVFLGAGKDLFTGGRLTDAKLAERLAAQAKGFVKYAAAVKGA